jgi:hypothetical protein
VLDGSLSLQARAPIHSPLIQTILNSLMINFGAHADCIGCMVKHLQAELNSNDESAGIAQQNRTPIGKAATACWNSCESVAEPLLPALLAGGALLFTGSVFAVSSLVPICLMCCTRPEPPKEIHLVRLCVYLLL